jgi:hypothetical protein
MSAILSSAELILVASLFNLCMKILASLTTVSSFSRFLFPALGGFLYGYDIGATSSANISLQVYLSSSLFHF